MNGGKKPPVQPGDQVTAVIESVGGKGDGMARVKGFVLFIPEGKKGKTYKLQITKVHDRFGFGEIINEEAEQ